MSEYLSVGKPILAIGPRDIGTMDYLSDSAVCANSFEEIGEKVSELLKSTELQKKNGEIAFDKYLKYHVKDKIQQPFLKIVFGE